MTVREFKIRLYGLMVSESDTSLLIEKAKYDGKTTHFHMGTWLEIYLKSLKNGLTVNEVLEDKTIVTKSLENKFNRN